MTVIDFIFGRRTPPPAAPAPEPAATLPSADETPGRYLPYSLAQVREFGCHAAETGGGLNLYHARFHNIAEAHAKAIALEHDEQAAREKAQLRVLQDETSALLQEEDPDEPFETADALRSALERSNAAVTRLVRAARAAGSAAFARGGREALADLAAIEGEWLEAQLTPANRMLEVARNGWQENESEFTRRADGLERMAAECTALLARARSRTEAMHDAGITRHVSGFLIWASTASLLGGGMAVSQLVRGVLVEDNTRESLLRQWLMNVRTPSQLFRLLGTVIGVLLVTLTVIAVVAMLVRYLLTRTDPGWRGKQRPKASDSEGWLGWLGMFGTPGVTPSIVTDRSLQQLIGSLPLVLAAALVAFLFLSLGDGAETGATFVASQLGPAFLILSVVAAVVMVTSMATSRQKQASGSGRIVLLGLLGAAPALALLLAGLLPALQERAALTAITIAMTVSASGLGMGLIYRGLFAREEFLEREIARCDARIAALREKPTLASMLVHSPRNRMSIRIRKDVRTALLTLRVRAWHRLWHRLRSRLVGGVYRDYEGRFAAPDSDADELDELAMSPEQRAELHGLRAVRDRLRSRWDRLSEVRKESHLVQTRLSENAIARATRERALAVERELVGLELENAYHIACTALHGPIGPSAGGPAGPTRNVPVVPVNELVNGSDAFDDGVDPGTPAYAGAPHTDGDDA